MEAMRIHTKQVHGGVNDIKTELSQNATLVLQAPEKKGKLTQSQLSNTLQASVRTVQRALKELREKNSIAREGSDKRGQYIVLTSYSGPNS